MGLFITDNNAVMGQDAIMVKTFYRNQVQLDSAVLLL